MSSNSAEAALRLTPAPQWTTVKRMLAHLGQPLYAKTEQRFDIRWRCRSRPLYYTRGLKYDDPLLFGTH